MCDHGPVCRICLCVSENLPPSSASYDLSGTDSALYPYEPHEDTGYQELWLPPTSLYPYFLYPPGGTSGPRLSSAYYELDLDLAASLEEQQQQYQQQRNNNAELTAAAASAAGGRPKIYLYPDALPPELLDSAAAIRVFENDRWQTQWMHVRLAPPPITSHITPPTHDRDSQSTKSTTTATSSVITEHKSQHDEDGRLHHRHRHRHHQPNLQHHLDRDLAPPPPALALPRTTTTTMMIVRRKFAPRPTYEHGAAYERPDEEFEGLDEFRGAGGDAGQGRLPIDRLADLREAFAGFVDSGS